MVVPPSLMGDVKGALLTKKSSKGGAALPEPKDFVGYGTGDGQRSTFQIGGDELMARKRWRKRIWYNVCILGIAWFFLMSGVVPITLVQSSLNSQAGLGVAALSVKHGSMLLGSLVASTFVRRFGCRRCLRVSIFLYSIYVAANFYPSWYTLIPAAAISGLAASVLFTAQNVYLARLAHLLHSFDARTKSFSDCNDDDEPDRMQSRIFVVTTVFSKVSVTYGDVVSSLILGTNGYTQIWEAGRLALCGTNYCNEDLDMALAPSSASASNQTHDDATVTVSKSMAESWKLQVYGLCGFCVASCLLGSILVTFVDSLPKLEMNMGQIQLQHQDVPPPNTAVLAEQKRRPPLRQQLADIIRAMVNVRHLLLMPMAAVINAEDAFWNADFTKAFITCAMGVQFIGYVSVWNGISGAVASIVFGWFNKKKVRSVPFALATILQVGVLTVMYCWRPNSDNYLQMSLFAVVWFFGSGIRQFVVPALYAVLFSDNLEVAFSVFHIWTFSASTAVYAFSNLLCMSTKIYIMLGLMTTSFLCYVGVEVIAHMEKDRTAYLKLGHGVEVQHR